MNEVPATQIIEMKVGETTAKVLMVETNLSEVALAEEGLIHSAEVVFNHEEDKVNVEILAVEVVEVDLADQINHDLEENIETVIKDKVVINFKITTKDQKDGKVIKTRNSNIEITTTRQGLLDTCHFLHNTKILYTILRSTDFTLTNFVQTCPIIS